MSSGFFASTTSPMFSSFSQNEVVSKAVSSDTLGKLVQSLMEWLFGRGFDYHQVHLI